MLGDGDMRRSRATWLFLPALLACRLQPAVPPAAPAAPNLGGTYRDDAGELRSVVRILGRISFGQRVEGPLPETDELAGYTFEAAAGAVALADYTYSGDAEQSGLALYGPRSEAGLWGDPLASAVLDGSATLLLEGPAVPSAGDYLLLVRNLGAGGSDSSASGRFVLQLGCRGTCPAPTCPDVEPCDRVCSRGFVTDEQGCRRCQCQQASECVEAEDCSVGERCSPEGRCEPEPDPCEGCPGTYEPVCGVDGRTYGNACRAECVTAAIEHRGPCVAPPECDDEQPCPMGLICAEGQCEEPECNCVDEPETGVCSRTGRSWRNLCELQCRPGEELAYLGRCREGGCDSDRECPDDTVCLPLPDERVQRECARDPRSRGCMRVCLAPPLLPCGPERLCPDGQRCHPTPIPDLGLCLQPCRRDEPDACPAGTTCVVAEEQQVGSCLLHCAPDRTCPPGSACQRGPEDQPVCGLCSCPDDPELSPVCAADGRTYPSACAARCAGQDRFSDGACDEAAPCVCGAAPEPICGADGVVYNNRCELACAEERPAEAAACWPEAPELRCRQDEDCEPTGCGESVCAAAPTRACPRYSGEAMCHVRFGACGCQQGRCLFGQTAESRTCILRTRESLGGEADAAPPRQP